jgi:hypothetical protein
MDNLEQGGCRLDKEVVDNAPLKLFTPDQIVEVELIVIKSVFLRFNGIENLNE